MAFWCLTASESCNPARVKYCLWWVRGGRCMALYRST